MARKWLRERSRDTWHRLAKSEGYRTRASFKLLQIQEKFRVIREGDTIVDLGAAPGGWTQVALELTGPEGHVVGVDLDRIDPLPRAMFIRGDMTRPETMSAVMEETGGAADVVVSDMSPNISGAYATDHARSIWLCENALTFAERILRPEGRFVCKVFDGDLLPKLRANARKRFQDVRIMRPPASRKTSSEVYLVARRFRGPAPYEPEPEPTSTWQEGDGPPPSRKARRD